MLLCQIYVNKNFAIFFYFAWRFSIVFLKIYYYFSFSLKKLVSFSFDLLPAVYIFFGVSCLTNISGGREEDHSVGPREKGDSFQQCTLSVFPKTEKPFTRKGFEKWWECIGVEPTADLSTCQQL